MVPAAPQISRTIGVPHTKLLLSSSSLCFGVPAAAILRPVTCQTLLNHLLADIATIHAALRHHALILLVVADQHAIHTVTLNERPERLLRLSPNVHVTANSPPVILRRVEAMHPDRE
jgi:hypothetical protein